MEGDEGNEEKRKWEVGFEYAGFKVWVSRTIETIGKLKRIAESPKRSSFFSKKSKQNNPDYGELRDEFRAFLLGVRDNVNLYLWFALSALTERNVDRKYEAKIYHLFGDVTTTFLQIQQSFDPSKVTTDLLDFLKERITRIVSPGAFDITGNASTINQGNGEQRFNDSVNTFERMLTEIRHETSKYFKPLTLPEG